MTRNKSKSPNGILKYKPNQFPRTRFGNIAWEQRADSKAVTDNANAEATDSTTTETTETDARLEYLRNRFESGSGS